MQTEPGVETELKKEQEQGLRRRLGGGTDLGSPAAEQLQAGFQPHPYGYHEASHAASAGLLFPGLYLKWVLQGQSLCRKPEEVWFGPSPEPEIEARSSVPEQQEQLGQQLRLEPVRP